MISARQAAWLGSRLPEAALGGVFGGAWPVAAGSVVPGGSAAPEPGGWRIDGRWGWGSGIDHADWVIANAPLAGDPPGGGPPEFVAAALPAAEVEIEDSWRPLGMRDTGSAHYRVEGKFVPADRRLAPFDAPVLRGGGWLSQPSITFLCAGAIAMRLGIAERALEEIERIAASRVHVGQRSPLAEREAFQRGSSPNCRRRRIPPRRWSATPPPARPAATPSKKAIRWSGLCATRRRCPRT